MSIVVTHRLLELVREALHPLVVPKRKSTPPIDQRQRGDDVYGLLTFVVRNPSLFPEFNKRALNCAHEILTGRNEFAHQEPVDVRRLADTVRILLASIKASGTEEAAQIHQSFAEATAVPNAASVASAWPEIVVVTCTAKKRSGRARAEDLYDPSPLFRLCVEQLRRDSKPWLIVSSKYGLVEPGRQLQSYEEDPKKWSADKRKTWTDLLTEQARRLTTEHGIVRVALLAGTEYRSAVSAAFGSTGVPCVVHPEWTRISTAAFPKK